MKDLLLVLVHIDLFFCVFQGSDEELMAHSEDEHEVDTVANKGQCQELFISEQQGRFQMCRS